MDDGSRGETTLDKIVEVLNSAVQNDPVAMKNLLGNRVPCNEALANHPLVQSAECDFEFDDEQGSQKKTLDSIGALGVINAIVEKLTGQRVAAEYDEEDNLLRFIPYWVAEDRFGV
jgi:hypothetical protein